MGAAAAGPDRGSRRSVAWASMVRDHRLHLAADHHPCRAIDARSQVRLPGKAASTRCPRRSLAVWLRRPGARADLDSMSTNLENRRGAGSQAELETPLIPRQSYSQDPRAYFPRSGLILEYCGHHVHLVLRCRGQLKTTFRGRRPRLREAIKERPTMSIVQRSAAERLSGAPARPSASGGRA
jgi:hypothetical protein